MSGKELPDGKKETEGRIMDYFQGMGVTRLTAGTALKNLPSVKLLQRTGFRQTGTEKVSFYKDRTGDDIIFDGGIYEWTPEKNI